MDLVDVGHLWVVAAWAVVFIAVVATARGK